MKAKRRDAPATIREAARSETQDCLHWIDPVPRLTDAVSREAFDHFFRHIGRQGVISHGDIFRICLGLLPRILEKHDFDVRDFPWQRAARVAERLEAQNARTMGILVLRNRLPGACRSLLGNREPTEHLYQSIQDETERRMVLAEAVRIGMLASLLRGLQDRGVRLPDFSILGTRSASTDEMRELVSGPVVQEWPLQVLPWSDEAHFSTHQEIMFRVLSAQFILTPLQLADLACGILPEVLAEHGIKEGEYGPSEIHELQRRGTINYLRSLARTFIAQRFPDLFCHLFDCPRLSLLDEQAELRRNDRLRRHALLFKTFQLIAGVSGIEFEQPAAEFVGDRITFN